MANDTKGGKHNRSPDTMKRLSQIGNDIAMIGVDRRRRSFECLQDVAFGLAPYVAMLLLAIPAYCYMWTHRKDVVGIGERQATLPNTTKASVAEELQQIRIDLDDLRGRESLGEAIVYAVREISSDWATVTSNELKERATRSKREGQMLSAPVSAPDGRILDSPQPSGVILKGDVGNVPPEETGPIPRQRNP